MKPFLSTLKNSFSIPLLIIKSLKKSLGEAESSKGKIEEAHKAQVKELKELKEQRTKEIEKLHNEFASKETEIKANLSASQSSSISEIESLKKSLDTAKSEYEAGLKAAHDKNALENKKRLQVILVPT